MMRPSRIIRNVVAGFIIAILLFIIWLMKASHFSFEHHLGIGFGVETGSIMDTPSPPNLTSDFSDRTTSNVHTFYYAWYGTPEFDERYYHWNHEFLPHWNEQMRARYPSGFHKPPDDIGANFYPSLGLYSSIDPKVVDTHMEWIRWTGSGVVVVSYYPVGLADGQGKPMDLALYQLIYDAAAKYDLKVALHIEPYTGRSVDSLVKDIEFMRDNFAEHDAFYTYNYRGVIKPLVYVYDSYLLEDWQWRAFFERVRDTDFDCHFIGLLTTESSISDVIKAGFDGLYTYFASQGFTYGSNWDNWAFIAKKIADQDKIFIPSVGPGYIDTRVRPWNKKNIRHRRDGEYYRQSWTSALASNAPIISVTSFNEWHEGTQIEPASPKFVKTGLQYLSYAPHPPEFYLEITRNFTRLKS